MHGTFIPIDMYFDRMISENILTGLKNNPVVAILGPRQCGKSTIAKHLLKELGDFIFLDLERPSDLAKLENAEWFLESQKNKLICIDEIQRLPGLFPLIRSLTDEWAMPGKFLMLGSVSLDLLKQSSESLAGRISYKRLTPFLLRELPPEVDLVTYIERGGFPRSFLAESNNISLSWRADFITTFLERDVLQWSGIAPVKLRRLWSMLAHNNGQTVNYSQLGNSLNMTSSTVKNYVDLLEASYMLNVLQPYYSSLGKRLIKAPKVYLADSGLLASLLRLENFSQITGHPAFGSLWETVVLANLRGHFPEATFCFYRTSNGAEIDIVMELSGRVFAIECKASMNPGLTKGNYLAIEDIKPIKTFVVAPVKENWEIKKGIQVVSLAEIIMQIQHL